MKTSTRNILLLVTALVFALGLGMYYFSMPTVIINDEVVDGAMGLGFGFAGMVIGLIATVFAIAVTGMVMAGVSVVLVLVFAALACVFLFALSPILVPALLLIAIVMFFQRRKTA